AASLIAPSLYLGPCTAASSRDFISSNAVTHILSIGCSPSKRFEGVTYQRVALDDSPTSSITKACDVACDFIDDALNSQQGNGRILVHCKLGISRSSTIVAAYLMRRREMSLRDALRQILQARPQIQPNPGFILQLKEMEMGLRGEVSLDIVEFSKLQKDRL
ncbi:phosphatases II, partial [Schizopora paradoxa]